MMWAWALDVVAIILLILWACAVCFFGRQPPEEEEEEEEEQQQETVTSTTSTSISKPPPPRREQKTGVASISYTFKSSSLSCAICLEDYKSGDECRCFVKCDHSYHKACIDPWLAQGKRCPLCREPVRGGSVREPDSLDQVV